MKDYIFILVFGVIVLFGSFLYKTEPTIPKPKIDTVSKTVSKTISKIVPKNIPKVLPQNTPTLNTPETDALDKFITTLEPPTPMSDEQIEFERRVDEYEKGLK